MPRSNRRRDDVVPLDLGRAVGGPPRRERYAGGEWLVRTVSGSRSGSGSGSGSGAGRSSYLCPGCQQAIDPGTSHVVAWPDDGLGDVTDRRHWHTACWRARDTRRPLGSYR